MMVLHVFTKNRNMATEIARELFNQKLIFNASIHANATTFEQTGTELIENDMTLLTVIGKAMNYPEATALIDQMFPNDKPVFYSTPVINYNSAAKSLPT